MNFIHLYTVILVAFLLSITTASAQTTIYGKMLSVDGRTIPKTIISIQQQDARDIFSGYEDVSAGGDGSYSIIIHEPGLYNITFRGIYHRTIIIPFLIIDQDSIEMDLLMIPAIYNDGRYFDNDEYLEWIRVYGNFNEYDVLTGIPFNLNNDGSISAFIPVTSETDTIRYQVRGLGYGRMGASPLPQADDYAIRDNRSFESVLYRNLPPDSLEIRYNPGETIPFQRLLPFDADQEGLLADVFLNFQNQSDRYWVEPIHLIRNFRINILPVLEQDLSNGLTTAEQVNLIEKYSSELSMVQHIELIQRIRDTYYRSDIHPQQKAILSICYASLLHQIEMLNRMSNQNSITMREMLDIGKPNVNKSEPDPFGDLIIDQEILQQIPNHVSPTHPVLGRAQIFPQFLLNITENHPNLLNFYKEIAKHHPNDFTIERYVIAMIRALASNYESVEQMEVYQIVVDRYGERELARRSHETFRIYQFYDR